MTFLQMLGNGVFRQKGQSHATVDQLGNGDSTVYEQTMLEQQTLDGRQLIEPGIAKSAVLRSDDVVYIQLRSTLKQNRARRYR